MATVFIADVPGFPASPFGVADSGSINAIAIDAELRVHVAFVSNVATGGGANTLTYAIGTPDGPLQVFGHAPLILLKQYQWQFHAVLPPAQWTIVSLFDLALDSQGRAHLCFSDEGMDDDAQTPDLKHAVWDEKNSQFDLTVVQQSSFASGLAMTIAKGDSVHIGFSDDLGLHYATQTKAANSFHVEDVDTQRPATIRDVSIAVGSGGQIGISYLFLSGANSLGIQLRFAQKMPAAWIVDTADPGPVSTAPMDSMHPGTNSLVIDGFGLPHIAYFSAGRGLCHGTRTTPGQFFWAMSGSGNGEVVDPTGTSTPAKILLDSNNVLRIAYQGLTPAGTTDLRFATRATSGTWGMVTVDPSTNCGWGTSAAMDPNGMPHFAYGFTPIVNGLIALKHTYAVNLTLMQIPQPRKKRPILRRPGQ
jgi:hypothetical protein